MHLYEISEAILKINRMIEDGIPLDQVSETLSEMEDDFEQKVKNILFYMADVDGDIEKIKAEEKRLAALRKSLEGRKNFYREYVRSNMIATKTGPISNGVHRASLAKGRDSLLVPDPAELPDKYITDISLNYEYDKDLLKKDLEAGEEITGASIVTGEKSLRIAAGTK